MARKGKSGHPRGNVDLGKVRYPSHVFDIDPQTLLNFTELKWFQVDWKDLGLDAEFDLSRLQFEPMLDPKSGDVIPEAGAPRKLRHAPQKWKVGKRGALRVLYVYFEEFGHVLLVMAYPKNDEQPLSPVERKRIKQLIDEEKEILNKRHFA